MVENIILADKLRLGAASGQLSWCGTYLAETLTGNHAETSPNFGAEFLSAEVESLDLDGDIKTVKTNRGDKQLFGILLGHRRTSPCGIGFQGEEAFRGHSRLLCHL